MLESTTIVMLKNRVMALFKIQPDEVRMFVLFAGLFLCVQAGLGVSDNAAFALFLSSIDVNYLPYMYMGLGGLVFLSTALFSASLSRFQNASVVRNTLTGLAVLFALEWIATLRFGGFFTYAFLWLTTYAAGYVLITLLWSTAGEVCDARQAKRLFPLFTSMGILGNILGNLVTGRIAHLAGTESLILLFAALLGVGYLLIRKITGNYFIPEEETAAPFSLWNDLRAGYDFMRNARLFRMIAVSSILFSILYFTVDFPFSEKISEVYANNAAGLAGFKGLFTSITTLVTFLVSLLLANRLYTKLGIVNSVLIMPVTYITAFVLFLISFNFEGAVSARFLQLVVYRGLVATAWNALFNIVPLERRGQVLSFNNGVPSQIGIVLSGVLILVGRQMLDTHAVLFLGVIVAVILAIINLRMRPAYGDALLTALQAGRSDVFDGEEEAFSGYKDDPAAMQVVRKALQDPRPQTRRLAVEMLAHMGNTLAAPDLVERLSDDDADVRAAAVTGLTKLGMKQVSETIQGGLNDPHEFVRAAVLASLPRLEVASSPELIQTLEYLLSDSNGKVSARAAVVLLYLGETKRANLFLSTLLKSEEEQKRIDALSAYLAIASGVKNTIPFNRDLIVDVLDDPASIVRSDAIQVASYFMDEGLVELVSHHLSDEDAAVRRTASESLKQAWPRSRNVLLHLLAGSDDVAVSSALDSIPAGEADLLNPLKGYIQREVAAIRYWRMLAAPLPRSGKAVGFLIDILKSRVSASEDRLVKAVGLLGNPRAMGLVRKGLNAGDASSRAAALETLETLGDKRITNVVLPILDRGGLLQTGDDQPMRIADVINVLLEGDEQRLRVLALYAIAELKLRDFMLVLRKATMDDDPLIQESAREALGRLGGTVVMSASKTQKTLKTLSVVDCTLLLREVSMFSGLSANDLERIAEIADEQLYSDQSLLCREGEYGDSLFIITSGKVDVVKQAGKSETVLASHGVGDYVGEMAVIESAPRSATLRANGSVRVLAISGDAFKAILTSRPEVAVSVLKQMSRRLRQLNQQVAAAP